MIQMPIRLCYAQAFTPRVFYNPLMVEVTALQYSNEWTVPCSFRLLPSEKTKEEENESCINDDFNDVF